MTSTWHGATASHRHLVQVYRERGFLVRAVAAWVADSLRAGGGAVLACTPRSAEEVFARLQATGVDAAAAQRDGRLLALDADDLLGRFMRDGTPEGALFHAVAGDAVARVRSSVRPGAEVRAWGEMVDLLTKRGNAAAAQRLESLWNELIDERQIRLLCSYELDHLTPDAHDGPLQAACAGHSHLISEEDPVALEAAVEDALVEVYGEREAAHVRALLAPQRVLPIGMTSATSILVALQKTDAERGRRVLAAARRIMAAGRPTAA